MSFNYIHTTSTLKFHSLEQIILDENVNNYLFSLIGGLSQSQFGFNTISKVVNKHIIPFYNNLKEGQRLFIDSGGYSIIKSDVHPRDLSKAIDCYCYFLEHYRNYYDIIVSLDIPIFLEHPECNNVSFIRKQNHISISRSKKILDKYPELYDKFAFTWQFKLLKQYKIWKELYETYFENEDRLYNFTIGGLVGLAGITNIQFSPFIAMCYKCLNLIEKKDLKKESLIHILGIYGTQYRVCATFIDRLFNEVYLKDKKPSVEVSYDTINYSVSGYMRVRNLDNIIYENNNYKSKLIEHYSEEDVKTFIKDEDVQKQIIKDINNLKNGQSIEKTHIFAVINVIKQIKIDSIIKEIIYNGPLFDHFLNCDNYNQFKGTAKSILSSYEVKYPFIFKNKTNKNLCNFQYLYEFHNWYKNDRTEKRLEEMIEKFISHIKFPFDLDD